MKETKNPKWRGKLRPVVFLLPAAIIVALVLITLPLTAPILKDLPEKLEYVMPIIAEAATVKAEKPKATTEKQPSAFFDYEDGVFTGSAYGYGGDVQVQVTVKNGYITEVSILNAPGETEPYFSLAKSILPSIYDKQTWEIDVVSGATYSSKGILGAVQNAITGEVVENEHPAEENRVVDTETFKEPSAYKDGTYTGTAQGFGGPITVKVVIKNGKLKAVKVTDASGETPEYYAKAISVVAAIMKAGSPNVDTVSGATYSSSGIITAVKRALVKAGGKPEKSTDKKKTKKEKDPKKKDKAKKKKKTTEHKDLTDTELADGTFTGTGFGFGGDINVEVTIKKGKITKIKILSADDETPEYFSKAKVITKTMIEKQNPNVDTVSGATFSSEGIIEAVENALLKSAAQYKKDHPAKEEKETKPEETTSAEEKETTTEPEPEEFSKEEETTGDEPDSEEETTEETGRFKDGTYTGAAWCDGWPDVDFYYQMIATVTVEQGRITDISVGISDDDSEYPEDNTAFINYAVNGRTLRGVYHAGIPQQIVDQQDTVGVDVVSGATYSSRSILEAVQAALAQAVNE